MESTNLKNLKDENSEDSLDQNCTAAVESSEEERFILLSLCGHIYQLHLQALINSPSKSLLTRFAASTDEERERMANWRCPETGAYYFTRSPMFFDYILHFHSSGELHSPPMVCANIFLEELKFWEINEELIADCCRPRLGLPVLNVPRLSIPCSEFDEMTLTVPAPGNELRNGSVFNRENDQNENLPETPIERPEDEFSTVCCGTFRRKVWCVLEAGTPVRAGSKKKLLAKIFAAISVLLIIVSVVTLILGSMREFQDDNKEPKRVLIYMEYVCVVWFTIEYFSRLIVTARKWQFLKNLINVVDALSIFPFHLEICLLAFGVQPDDLQNFKGALLAMRVLRLLRVARVFKLARYSAGLQSFIQTLSSSRKELGMLMMFLSTAVLLFSTTIYFMEKDAEKTPFTSIPATFWWAIVTMTTVGYGDMIPVTVAGKLVASFATITGVIVLAFPITMIVENFCRYYQTDVFYSNEGDMNDSESYRRRRRLHVKSAAII